MPATRAEQFVLARHVLTTIPAGSSASTFKAYATHSRSISNDTGMLTSRTRAKNNKVSITGRGIPGTLGAPRYSAGDTFTNIDPTSSSHFRPILAISLSPTASFSYTPESDLVFQHTPISVRCAACITVARRRVAFYSVFRLYPIVLRSAASCTHVSADSGVLFTGGSH